MFERICALLFRLYPLEFRRTHGRDAWQLIRDRAHHERGAFLRARLLGDLATDIVSTTFTWRPPAPVQAKAYGAPRFEFIEPHRPRPQAMLAGTLASSLMLVSFALLFEARVFPPAPLHVGEGSGADARGFEDAASTDQNVVVAGAAARHDIIGKVAESIRTGYFDSTTAQQLANALLAFEKNGSYESIGTGAELASRLTGDIYDTGRALGVPNGAFVAEVINSRESLTAPPPQMTAATRDRDRIRLLEQNCRFERIEMLSGNIGYLKLNGFPEPTACQETATRAMAAVNSAAALILDLRDNGGGMGEVALHMAGYLFDRPAFLWDPRPYSRVPTHTSSPVAGSKLADKPVYLLASSRTQSAAEYFVYNLKMLKRVTIVGERTAGNQHSGRFEVLDDHFGIAIQTTPPPENPYPVKGWETIGVEPDVAVPGGDAFAVARVLAESRAGRPSSHR